MQPLSASDLLEIWERGVSRPPVEQALAILETAFPDAPAGGLADLTIGQRDALLLELRALTFGPQLKGLATCPACGERLELAFDIDRLLPARPALPGPGSPGAQRPALSLTAGAYEVTFRLPSSGDVRSLAGVETPELARQRLVEACVLAVRKSGKPVEPGDLPAEVVDALAERMNQAEPLANLSLEAACPACRHAWQILFDIVTYFWGEIEAWAARLMREVHVLASAYGWREADVLAMSAWRRQRYLELIGV